jgi:polar amino acid transport system substrate-binding protein
MTTTRRTALGLLTAVLLAGAAVAPASAQTPEEIKEKGTLTVGMLVDFPPFGIMNAQNQPDGYDADVAKLLAEHLGVPLTIVPVTGPNRIPYLLSGQVDVLVASRASTQDTALTAVAPADATIQRFDDDASAVQALLAGQVEGIGISNVVGMQIKQVAGDRFDDKFELSQQVQGIAVRPGSDELLAEINAFIEAVKADGTLSEIHEKWLGSPLPDFVQAAN